LRLRRHWVRHVVCANVELERAGIRVCAKVVGDVAVTILIVKPIIFASRIFTACQPGRVDRGEEGTCKRGVGECSFLYLLNSTGRVIAK